MMKFSRQASWPLCRASHRGRRRGQAGFTVIELLIVLVVLGVLVAVGIPTYFTLAHERTDPQAQSSLESALGIANTFFKQQGNTYKNLCPTKLCGAATQKFPTPDGYMGILAQNGSGPIGVNNTPSTSTGTVSIDIVNNSFDVILAALAQGTGNCWAIIDVQQPGFSFDGLNNILVPKPGAKGAAAINGLSFVGILHAAIPAAQMGRYGGKCKAGLFDTGKLVGSDPVFGPIVQKKPPFLHAEPGSWPAT